MANGTASFGPDELVGDPLPPILERRSASTPPGVEDTNATVYATSTSQSDHQSTPRSHPPTVVTREVVLNPPTPVQEHPSETPLSKQPSDIWSKLPNRDGDDEDHQGRLSRRGSFKNLLDRSLSRIDSNLSNLSNESVAGSTASSVRRRMSALKRLSARQTEIAPGKPTPEPPAKHRTFHEMLDQTLDKVEQQLRKSRRDKPARSVSRSRSPLPPMKSRGT